MRSIIINTLFCLSVAALFTFLNGCVGHDDGAQSTSGPQQINTDHNGNPNAGNNINGNGAPNDQDTSANGRIDNSNTSPDNYVSGMAVEAVDTFHFTFSTAAGQLNNILSSTQIINLQDVRDSIKNHGIDLSTFSITDLSIVAQGANGYIQANGTTHVVVTVSYFDAGNNKILALESAAQSGLAGPILTMGDLAKGLTLNKEIFGSKPGFTDFTNMIKDLSKTSVSTIVEIKSLDAPLQGGPDLNLSFVITAGGKKPF